jgi:dTDP-4-dehydrorhamnose reductase
MRVLVLGASGMIGSTMHRMLSENRDWKVMGSIRSVEPQLPHAASNMLLGTDLSNADQLLRLFHDARPNVVVNCAGLTKHLPGGNEPLPALMMNSVLPHRLAELCTVAGCYLIHVSTDCVFSGQIGSYRETDTPDASDIYGKTKSLGEVAGPQLVTLRTATIGHELKTRHGLLEWFLAQNQCKGFRRAIFSGLTTMEFARVVRDKVIPNRELSGLYHVGGAAIDKCSLLQLVAEVYGKQTEIVPDDNLVLDRSLNAEKFASATGYKAPDWRTLVECMYRDHKK